MADIRRVTNDYTLQGLNGPQRNAAGAVIDLFNNYGLGSLAGQIINMVKAGNSADTISLLLQDTPEFRARFAANVTREKKGLPVLSPAEYLSTEQSYRQIMHAAGVPAGFYDKPQDFQKFLEQDISPSEVQSRVQAATQFIDNADKATLDTAHKWYTKGDLIAYALDPKTALPLIERRFQNAELGGAAAQQGIDIGQGKADELRQQGVTREQAQQGFGFVASEIGNANKLADISGENDFTTNDLVGEVLQNNQQVAQRRRKLASQERGRFSGTSGIDKDSLSSDSGGLL